MPLHRRHECSHGGYCLQTHEPISLETSCEDACSLCVVDSRIPDIRIHVEAMEQLVSPSDSYLSCPSSGELQSHVEHEVELTNQENERSINQRLEVSVSQVLEQRDRNQNPSLRKRASALFTRQTLETSICGSVLHEYLGHH